MLYYTKKCWVSGLCPTQSPAIRYPQESVFCMRPFDMVCIEPPASFNIWKWYVQSVIAWYSRHNKNNVLSFLGAGIQKMATKTN